MWKLVAFAALVVAVSAGSEWDGQLSAGDDKTKPHIIKFTLKNLSTEKKQILVWGTPLFANGVIDEADVFKIDGVKYEGITTKRSYEYVHQSDIITIDGGKSVDKLVDLSSAYSLKPGTVKVQPVFNVLEVKKNFEQKDAKGYFDVNITKGFKLESPAFDVTIANPVTAAGPKKAGGPAFLEAAVDLKGLRRRRAVTYDNNCNAHQVRIQAQLALAVAELQTAKNWAANNQCQAKKQWTKWFGASDATRTTDVRGVLANVEGYLTGNVKFDCSKNNCGASVWAYVYKNDNSKTVYLCGTWLDNNSNTEDHKQTFIHEVSHFNPSGRDDVKYKSTFLLIFNIDTMAYGKSNSKELATKDAAKAVMNADNIGYFVTQADFPQC